MFKLITLITYLLSCYSCFDLPWLALAYLSLHLTVPCVLTYQHTWFCLFVSFLFFAPIIFFSCPLCQTNFDFEISPPRVLSLTFTFYHFSFFNSPFNPSRLHFSQLASSACFCLLVWHLFFAAVRVSRTEGESVRFCPSLSLSTVPERREHARICTIPGNIRRKR